MLQNMSESGNANKFTEEDHLSSMRNGKQASMKQKRWEGVVLLFSCGDHVRDEGKGSSKEAQGGMTSGRRTGF